MSLSDIPSLENILMVGDRRSGTENAKNYMNKKPLRSLRLCEREYRGVYFPGNARGDIQRLTGIKGKVDIIVTMQIVEAKADFALLKAKHWVR